jgi:hypothetical protein
MTVENYIEMILTNIKEEVEFDIGVDSWGNVDQSSQNRVKFTVFNVKN